MAAAEGEERDPPGPAPDPREPRRISGRGGAMTHVPAEELESLALDELPRDRAAQVEAHAAACPHCARELSWLRAEQTLLARRPPAQTAHLWAGIAARLRHPLRRPHRAWRISVASGVAADDVNVRMRVLDGYAGYLRSLRDVVQDSEEAIP